MIIGHYNYKNYFRVLECDAHCLVTATEQTRNDFKFT